MVKKVAGWLLGLGLLVVAVTVWAEDAYAGRYVAQVQEIELRLQFIAQGKTVQGRMVWPPSAVYDFRGEVTQPSGNLVGVVRIKDHGLFFAARRMRERPEFDACQRIGADRGGGWPHGYDLSLSS